MQGEKNLPKEAQYPFPTPHKLHTAPRSSLITCKNELKKQIKSFPNCDKVRAFLTSLSSRRERKWILFHFRKLTYSDREMCKRSPCCRTLVRKSVMKKNFSSDKRNKSSKTYLGFVAQTISTDSAVFARYGQQFIFGSDFVLTWNKQENSFIVLKRK